MRFAPLHKVVEQTKKSNPMIKPLPWHGWLKVALALLFYLANFAVCVRFGLYHWSWWAKAPYVVSAFVLLSYVELMFLTAATPYSGARYSASWLDSFQDMILWMLRPALVCGLALPYLTYYYIAYNDNE
jgi:hypothetical protein